LPPSAGLINEVNSSTPIRVLIADDHALVRAGVRALLERLSDVQVVAEASDGFEVLDLIEQHEPHLVLMDIAMPGLNGLEATRALAKKHPEVRVVVLSIYADEEHVHQALRAGAAGYLVKGAALAELELAIRAVAHGETYLSPPISKPVIAEYLRRTHAEVNSVERLSPRQTEILKLLAEGKTTKQIALDLSISAKTVESHRAQLMERLDIHDLAGLVRYAIKTGLVEVG
jgi:DNA-binding NarL/FixJ family response regulator